MTTKAPKTDYSHLDDMDAKALQAHAVALKQTINKIDDDIKVEQTKRKPHAAELAATMGRLNTLSVAALAAQK